MSDLCQIIIIELWVILNDATYYANIINNNLSNCLTYLQMHDSQLFIITTFSNGLLQIIFQGTAHIFSYS